MCSKWRTAQHVIGPHGIYALFCADFGRKSAELNEIYATGTTRWVGKVENSAVLSVEFCRLEFSVSLLIAWFIYEVTYSGPVSDSLMFHMNTQFWPWDLQCHWACFTFENCYGPWFRSGCNINDKTIFTKISFSLWYSFDFNKTISC